jgi:tetratricopeptide (TPR) repeat protein
MGINTYEVMYIQAKDNYPYNVEECIEKLQYVISGDDEHAGAHCLMGQIFEEQLQDYKQAEHYYRMTLYLDRHYAPVYYSLANLLLRLNRFEESVKIIDLGLKAPGADIAALLYLKGLLYEKYEMYSTAVAFYNEAKKNCLNSSFMDAMDCHIKRVKDKKALLKKQEKKKDKSKAKKDKSKQKSS